MSDPEPREFDGFSPAHLDAFAAHKRASHRFGLERMRTHEALGALEGTLAPRLAAFTEGYAWRRTDPAPGIFNGHCVDGLWLHVDRVGPEHDALEREAHRAVSLSDSLREPHAMHRHAVAGVRIDQDGVAAGFWAHRHAALDLRNLSAALADPMERARLPVVLRDLPAEAEVLLDGISCPPARWIAGEAPAPETVSGWFSVRRAWSRQETLDLGRSIVDHLASALPSVLSLFRFAAWSPANDRLGLARKLREERRERGRKASGLEAGHRVEVTGGLLAGRQGEVMEVDAKGRVRVRLGLLSVELDPRTLRRL
ncbi:MAG: hypothetical protein FJ098_07135 [Deltaproteobacteria bacterium]|nr:hypothetical protein [Deltaproteobacteria bacterium]